MNSKQNHNNPPDLYYKPHHLSYNGLGRDKLVAWPCFLFSLLQSSHFLFFFFSVPLIKDHLSFMKATMGKKSQ